MRPLALLLILISSTALADTIELDAPDTCVVGELVTLDGSKSESELTWKVLRVDSSLEECLDFKSFGKVACFSARASSHWLVIVSGVSKDGKPSMITHSIVVGDGGGSVVNLESKIRTWARKVETENRREEAIKLAQSFRALAGAELPADKIIEATAFANKQALGDSLEAWMPFLDPLGDYLDEAGLETRDDYRRTWIEIAEAIERAFT